MGAIIFVGQLSAARSSHITHTMRGLLCILIALPAVLGFNCTGRPDGVYEAGGKSFVVCTQGVPSLTECDVSQVYNDTTGACADESQVGPPCGLKQDSSTRADGKFADVDNGCHSYYT